MSARSFWYHFSNAAHVSGMVWKSLLLTVFQIFYKALVTTYMLNINLCPYHFCIRRYSTNWDTQNVELKLWLKCLVCVPGPQMCLLYA